jgi:phosphoglycolate phosphatase-like HAD superfamily hydrolase
MPSWREGASKQAILDFVAKVTDETGPDFVSRVDRVATFDNDGTLWVEQPNYTQFVFAIDRIAQLAPEHPEWATTAPFSYVVSGDEAALGALGKDELAKLLMAGLTGMSTDEYEAIVQGWLARAQHPRFEQPYTACVYEPMREVIRFLQNNEFRVFIVTGGGLDFVRPFAESSYGIFRDQVVGSSVTTQYHADGDQLELIREPELFFLNDGEYKPVAIQKFIGRRPLAAFGNSDGDLEMLKWTVAGDGPRLGMIVHHTDGANEYAYDRDSSIGRLDRGLDVAYEYGFVIADMQRDWRKIFAFQP